MADPRFRAFENISSLITIQTGGGDCARTDFVRL